MLDKILQHFSGVKYKVDRFDCRALADGAEQGIKTLYSISI